MHPLHTFIRSGLFVQACWPLWAHVCAAPTPAGLERPIRDTPCRRFRRGYPVTAARSADAVPHPLIAAQTASQERGSPPHWTAPLEKERDAPSPHLYSVRSIRSGLLACYGARMHRTRSRGPGAPFPDCPESATLPGGAKARLPFRSRRAANWTHAGVDWGGNLFPPLKKSHPPHKFLFSTGIPAAKRSTSAAIRSSHDAGYGWPKQINRRRSYQLLPHTRLPATCGAHQ